ncbi:hypothetical protein L107_08883 [Cyanobium sp. Copco_Reservoir_LC18]|nr:hypothetical protein L107_08883 [Cyanobium sp. Copco_Reservoir_LC18]
MEDQRQVASRAPALLGGFLPVKGLIPLKLHQHAIGRKSFGHLTHFHHPGLESRQEAIELLLQLSFLLLQCKPLSMRQVNSGQAGGETGDLLLELALQARVPRQ